MKTAFLSLLCLALLVFAPAAMAAQNVTDMGPYTLVELSTASLAQNASEAFYFSVPSFAECDTTDSLAVMNTGPGASDSASVVVLGSPGYGHFRTIPILSATLADLSLTQVAVKPVLTSAPLVYWKVTVKNLSATAGVQTVRITLPH